MAKFDDYHQFYEAVYSQDTKVEPHGWIQWKGTRVCIDLHCICGAHGHYDSDFFFYYGKCKHCGRVYAIGQVVKLIELTPEQIKYIESRPASIEEFE